MSFNEKLLTCKRINKPFSSGGCTKVELNFLKDCATKFADSQTPDIKTTDIRINGKTSNVTALRKWAGDGTYLITRSSMNDWEGLVVKSLLDLSENNVIRYLHAKVFFNSGEDGGMEANLDILQMNYPIRPHIALNHIVTLLNKLNVPTGKSFVENCEGFSHWVESNHPKFANIPWPTALDHQRQ